MPAVSKSQRRLMGMAYAVKSGDKKISDMPEGIRSEIKKMVDGMSLKDLKDFASTKETNLPESVKEAIEYLQNNFPDFLHVPVNKNDVYEIVSYVGENNEISNQIPFYKKNIKIEVVHEDVATLGNVTTMGAVSAPTDSTTGSGDIFNGYDDETMRTPYCDPKKDKKCAKFRYLRSYEDWLKAKKEGTF